MINRLRKKNQELMQQYHNEKDDKNETIQKIINQIISDNDCFFKMTIEQAYTIFRELKVKENNFKNLYIELTKPKN